MTVAIIAMAVLGAVLGLILAYASKKFHVETDPRVDQVLEALPGANCGACGYPGCSAYAEAVVLKGAPINMCIPGATGSAMAIGKIMGVEATATEPRFAMVSCNGDGVAQRFEYQGVKTCNAASVMGLAGAFQNCPYGCLGLGSCAKACPFGAIRMGEDNLPYVDENLCTGCGKCAEVCPRKLPKVGPESRVIFVRCNNKDRGALANKTCNHACIGCGKCERECPFDAIHVINNLAVIDYDKCKLCGKCVNVCPKNLIINVRAERKARKTAREEKAAEETA